MSLEGHVLEAVGQALSALGGGGQTYFVGGCVRNWLLGQPVRDIDLAVSGDPEVFGQALLAQLEREDEGGTLVCLHPETSTYRIAWRGESTLDITPLGESIEANLRSRDFTVDAVAVAIDPIGHPASGIGHPIDPTGGLADLRAKRLRMVSAENLDADPLRLLRAGRLVAELNLSVDSDTEAAICQRAEQVLAAAGERIGEELMRTLGAPHASRGVRWLAQVDVLFAIMPELREMVGVEQNANHHLDVWEHTLTVVDRVEELMEWAAGIGDLGSGWRAVVPNSEFRIPNPDPTSDIGSLMKNVGMAENHLSFLWEALGKPRPGIRTRRGVLQLASLLHDVAKPRTRALNPRGEVCFWHHDEAGAEMADGICRRLRLSRRERDLCTRLVRHHLAPSFLGSEEMTRRRASKWRAPVARAARPCSQASGLCHCTSGAAPARERRSWESSIDPTERALYRLLRRADDWLPELLILSLADRLAAQGPYATPAAAARRASGALPRAGAFTQSASWRTGSAHLGEVPPPMIARHARITSALIERWQSAGWRIPPSPLLTGEEVMSTLGIEEGPMVGQCLRALAEAHALGEVRDREEAIRFLRAYASTGYKPVPPETPDI